MQQSYEPPCTITAELLKYAAEISEQVGRLSVGRLSSSALRLRRINRIRTVQGSLAIEGNTLSEAQITAILEGKRVLAPPREIREAENALDVYERIGDWNPASLNDLLKAHKVLMGDLIKDAGEFRSGGAGVMKGKDVVHVGPPASLFPTLVNQLLKWVNTCKEHPLICSSIFHYEFEYIHPFSDGNGRLGRLWQTLMLNAWNPLFAWLPVESMIHRHQKDYYAAIETATRGADTAPFVGFMLQTILEAVREAGTAIPEVTPEVVMLIKSLKGELSRMELMRKLRLKDEKNFRVTYLKPALEAGFVERTIPDKPTSRLQKYRLTDTGISLLKSRTKR